MLVLVMLLDLPVHLQCLLRAAGVRERFYAYSPGKNVVESHGFRRVRSTSMLM